MPAAARSYHPRMKAFACAVALLVSCADGRASSAELRASAGRLEAAGAGVYRVDVPGMRAEAPGDEGRRAELAFVYRGPTTRDVPLASGELRRQIGLKLRAADTCNLVYVMWHVEPKPGIAVSVKRNPGMHTHAECGARGYLNVRPESRAELPPVRAGERHLLAADLEGDILSVWADGTLAWRGALPPEARALRGPAGVRSDNGVFELALRIAREPPAAGPPVTRPTAGGRAR